MSDELPVAVADTGAMLAFFNPRDPAHEAAKAAIKRVGHLVLPPFVLAELDYLLTARAGGAVARSALRYLNQRVLLARYEVPEVSTHLAAASAVMDTYPDIGLTDAMNVVLAREFRTEVLLCTDERHFRKIRPLTAHDAFRLLADL